MSIIYIKTLYMESFLMACQLFKWSHFYAKFGFTAPVFLIPGRCDRFPGQTTPVPGRENRVPVFWIWSAIPSGFWRFSPGTGRFPVPGLRRESSSRRKRKPWFQLPTNSCRVSTWRRHLPNYPTTPCKRSSMAKSSRQNRPEHQTSHVAVLKTSNSQVLLQLN